MNLRQYRTIQVCGLRSKIFRQTAQIIGRHTDVWVPIFGQSDGIKFKQGVRRELCGIALKNSIHLHSIQNARELGGYITADGRKVKMASC